MDVDFDDAERMVARLQVICNHALTASPERRRAREEALKLCAQLADELARLKVQHRLMAAASGEALNESARLRQAAKQFAAAAGLEGAG